MEQLNNALSFKAFFVASKVGATGLTVTWDVYNPAGTKIVTAGTGIEIGGGLYSYTLASGSVTTEGEYLAIAKTAGTADQQHIPSLWTVGRGGIEHLDADVSSRTTGSLTNLDTPVSSRLSAGTYSTPPTVAQIRAEMDANSTKLTSILTSVGLRATPAQVEVIVSALSGGGGSVTHTEVITDDNDDPLDSVEVSLRATDDPADARLFVGRTDDLGRVTFSLDPGTYYMWGQHSRYQFNNPVEIEVEA